MKEEAPEINVGISVLQVKQRGSPKSPDLVVQDAVALVMVDNKKFEHFVGLINSRFLLIRTSCTSSIHS